MDKITIDQISFLTDFRNRRKDAGLTLRQVEDKTGISNAYLSQLETGKITNPSFSVVIKLHNLYVNTKIIELEQAKQILINNGFKISK